MAARRRRQPQLLADTSGEQRHAAGVLLRRHVALGEAHEQPAHAAAQVGLLGRHQVAGAEVADQRARGAAAEEVEHGRDADQGDAAQLERVPAVERRRAGADDELREERRQQPPAAGDDQQVRRPVGEGEGAQRPVREDRQARGAEGEQHDGRRGARLGHGRHERGVCECRGGEAEDADRQHGLEHEQWGDPPRPPEAWERREREQAGAHGQRGAAGECDHAVGSDEHARVAMPWTASSAVVVENAVPSSIARPSLARTPITVTPAATSAAVPALSMTAQKCAGAPGMTSRSPPSASATIGRASPAMASA
ncbi:MAG TPA: hypothetical protein VHJ39_00115 [Solirubrobacteraceae bacterium]|nr:hypothetical protein [Solirubrobacteraceae bacterium]